MGFYMTSPSERAQHTMRCLADLDHLRLQHRGEAGITMHPNVLPSAMLRPFQACGLDGAIYGFGVFDRCPKLRMIMGHLGEVLPFWA